MALKRVSKLKLRKSEAGQVVEGVQSYFKIDFIVNC